jgi:putative DNA primase/helicase
VSEVVAFQKRAKPPIGDRVWRLKEFLEEPDDMPPLLLDPWLRGGEQWMVHGAAGTGKTYFGLSVAWAVASGGSFLHWKAPAPRRVLYVDGEVATWEMRGRLRRMVAQRGRGDAARGIRNFRGYQMAAQPDGATFPDFGLDEGIDQFLKLARGQELVVVDNLSVCLRTGDPNAPAWWAPMQEALQELRKRSTATLLDHHQNKAGEQRGTNAKEDILDGVIRLQRPADYSATDGAKFMLSWDKGRALRGEDKTPVEAQLADDPEGGVKWNYRVIDHSRHLELMRLAQSGDYRTQRELAVAMDLKPTRITQLKAEAIKDGLFTSRQLNEWLDEGGRQKDREEPFAQEPFVGGEGDF